MKITDIDGLIKLEADEGKVLTTLEPSSLRVKLLYANKDSINNIIEVDEQPEIELPLYEEPNIEEPEEVLNGLTLVEAYHQLLNENRVLQEVTKQQNELINVAMTAIDEMFTTFEPLLCK